MQSLDVFAHSQSTTNNSAVNSVITSKTIVLLSAKLYRLTFQ